jgi:hypothetical protein
MESNRKLVQFKIDLIGTSSITEELFEKICEGFKGLGDLRRLKLRFPKKFRIG